MTLTASPERMPSTVAAARTIDVTTVYGSGDSAVQALDSVTVKLPAGRFSAVGLSGSGSSALLQRLNAVTSAQVYLGDVELGSLRDNERTEPRREQVRFVLQAFNLLPTLIARQETSCD